jgi:hypothetical protein
MSISAQNFIREVKQGDTVLARFATRDNAAGDGPDFGPATNVQVYVMRRLKPLKSRGQIRPAGELVELTAQNFVWASHDEDSWSNDFATFATENYYMQILQLNGADVIPGNPVDMQKERRLIQAALASRFGKVEFR